MAPPGHELLGGVERIGGHWLGDCGSMILWLTTAYDERDGLCSYLDRWPLYDPLRADPRFQALLQRMNFPAQP